MERSMEIILPSEVLNHAVLSVFIGLFSLRRRAIFSSRVRKLHPLVDHKHLPDGID